MVKYIRYTGSKIKRSKAVTDHVTKGKIYKLNEKSYISADDHRPTVLFPDEYTILNPLEIQLFLAKKRLQKALDTTEKM